MNSLPDSLPLSHLTVKESVFRLAKVGEVWRIIGNEGPTISTIGSRGNSEKWLSGEEMKKSNCILLYYIHFFPLAEHAFSDLSVLQTYKVAAIRYGANVTSHFLLHLEYQSVRESFNSRLAVKRRYSMHIVIPILYVCG